MILIIKELFLASGVKRNQDGVSIPLKTLPYHPVKDADHIAFYCGYYQHYQKQCLFLHIHIDRKAYAHLQDTMHKVDTTAAVQSIYNLAEHWSLAATLMSTTNVEIEVISCKLVAGKVQFVYYENKLLFLFTI